jgi:hypothetical protein
MKPIATSILALAALAAAGTAVRADEGCRPVDTFADDPSTLPGRTGWIWEDAVGRMYQGAKGLGAAISWKQIGPDRWVRDEENLVGYGEPVEIVKFDAYPPGTGSAGRMTVRRQDGREAVVTAEAVKLYEFWNCSVRQLLEDRRVPVKGDKFGRMQDAKWADSVWVRLVDKTVPVESDGTWRKPEDVAKIDLALCKQIVGPYRKPNPGEYDLSRCVPVSRRGWGTSFSVDPKAVELVSPTSMKILLGS